MREQGEDRGSQRRPTRERRESDGVRETGSYDFLSLERGLRSSPCDRIRRTDIHHGDVHHDYIKAKLTRPERTK